MANIPLEIWKPVVGYEDTYIVSSFGKVANAKTKRILKQYKEKSGYLRVCLSHNGSRKVWRVHRLVALTFLPNKENKPFIDHINGKRDDNRVENLRWCTNTENLTYPNAMYNRYIKQGVPVICIETGTIFQSAREAGRQLNINHANITSCCKNRLKTAGGLHFKYYEKG